VRGVADVRQLSGYSGAIIVDRVNRFVVLQDREVGGSASLSGRVQWRSPGGGALKQHPVSYFLTAIESWMKADGDRLGMGWTTT
jgi:hypothetical protein